MGNVARQSDVCQGFVSAISFFRYIVILRHCYVIVSTSPICVLYLRLVLVSIVCHCLEVLLQTLRGPADPILVWGWGLGLGACGLIAAWVFRLRGLCAVHCQKSDYFISLFCCTCLLRAMYGECLDYLAGELSYLRWQLLCVHACLRGGLFAGLLAWLCFVLLSN